MTYKFYLIALGLLALMVASTISSENAVSAWAKPADAYTIDWYTVDGGGVQDLSGGTYSLSGTIGQPDAGAQSGGSYALNGGFWSSGAANLLRFFLPAIMKNP